MIRLLRFCLIIFIMLLAAYPCAAVVYTFGDATVSAKQIDVSLRDRVAVATGAARVTKGDWTANADSITVAFDGRRSVTRIDFDGRVMFRGKLPQPRPSSGQPFADALRANAGEAVWVADAANARKGRGDEGVLTLTSNPRIEALMAAQITVTLSASKKIVARFNTGEISASENASITRSGSTVRKNGNAQADIITTYSATLTSSAVELRWDPETQFVESADARGNVRVRYASESANKKEKMVVTGDCESASWRRDPNWKGVAGEDQGVAVLRGGVVVEALTNDGDPQTTDEPTKVACEVLTHYFNEGRSVAEGGPEKQVDLTIEGEE